MDPRQLALSFVLVTACWIPQALAQNGAAASDDSDDEPRRATLAATGDVLLHRSVVNAAEAHGSAGGWQRSLAGLAAAIEEGELAIVNLETPLSNTVVPLTRGDHPVLGAPPEVAATLAACGVDVASVANNHAFDQDSLGLSQTMTALERAGIQHVGAASTEAEARQHVLVEHQGLRFAFLAATGPMNQRYRGRGDRLFVSRLRDEEAFLTAVGEARGAADVVVILVHWMWDYRRAPRRYERRLARRLIDAGADVILGAGPHLLHPVERLQSPRGEALVAWSLGNLISGMGMRWRPGLRPPPDMDPVSVLGGTRDAAVVHFELEVSAEGRVRFTRLWASPLWTRNNWRRAIRDRDLAHDIHVVPLEEVDEPLRSLRLEAIREGLGDEVDVELTGRQQ